MISMKQLIHKKRRLFTLLELLIAMTLTMLILSALAYFYRQFDAINQEMDVQQEELFKQLYLSTRLADILPKTTAPKSESDSFFFYTAPAGTEGSPSLVFSYNNGIKLDPDFSQDVLGRLYIDKDKRLCLAVWPSVARWGDLHTPPMKSEILMEPVESLAFRFYIPPKKDRKKVWEQAKMDVKIAENFTSTEGGEWRTDWPASWEQLPAIIEITLVTDKSSKPLILSYPLPNTNFMVVY